MTQHGTHTAESGRRVHTPQRDTPQRDTPGLQHSRDCGKLDKFNIPGLSVWITTRQCIGIQAFRRSLGRG